VCVVEYEGVITTGNLTLKYPKMALRKEKKNPTKHEHKCSL